MVELLKNSVGLGAPNDFYETIITNKGLKFLTEIECISFSGGVADCISTGALSDPFRYGDIGLLLGKAIAESSLMTEKSISNLSKPYGQQWSEPVHTQLKLAVVRLLTPRKFSQ